MMTMILLLPVVVDGVDPSAAGSGVDLSSGNVPVVKNPYTTGGGCLYSKGLIHQPRVCNSEDILPDAVKNGYCRLPDVGLEYQEMYVRTSKKARRAKN